MSPATFTGTSYGWTVVRRCLATQSDITLHYGSYVERRRILRAILLHINSHTCSHLAAAVILTSRHEGRSNHLAFSPDCHRELTLRSTLRLKSTGAGVTATILLTCQRDMLVTEYYP